MTHQQQALPLPAPQPTPGTTRAVDNTPDTPGAALRDCLQCGQVFTPQDQHTELCSDACARDWWGLEYIDFLEDNQRSIAA
jgi:hypothetical protein